MLLGGIRNVFFLKCLIKTTHCVIFTCYMILIVNNICAEQDEGLEKLEETVHSTKHIALAVNEELSLHTSLIVSIYIFNRIYSIRK